jgi:hypothetical protein
MTTPKIYLAQGAMEKPDTKITEFCKELGITPQTLYRHIGPKGEQRSDAHKLIAYIWPTYLHLPLGFLYIYKPRDAVLKVVDPPPPLLKAS